MARLHLLGPRGWLGVVVALAGATAIRIGAPRGDWTLVALGVVLCGVGAVVILADVSRRRRAGE